MVSIGTTRDVFSLVLKRVFASDSQDYYTGRGLESRSLSPIVLFDTFGIDFRHCFYTFPFLHFSIVDVPIAIKAFLMRTLPVQSTA